MQRKNDKKKEYRAQIERLSQEIAHLQALLADQIRAEQAQQFEYGRLLLSRNERRTVEQSPTFWTIQLPSLRAALASVLDLHRLFRGTAITSPSHASDRTASLSDWIAVAEDARIARLQMERLLQLHSDQDSSREADEAIPAGVQR